MELSKRLNWILEKVDKCETIMDVGTDHGYIPIQLIKKNLSNKVIASDINKDPLEKAKINVSLEGVLKNIDLRLGGGLAPLNKGEAEGIIIAGMGGNMIRDILESDLDKVKEVDYFILQPAQNPEVLREYLYTHDYKIIDEDICLDEGKYYELFKIKYKKSDNKNSFENLDYEISPLLLEKKSDIFRLYIENKIDKNKKIISFINEDTEHAKQRKELLVRKNEILKNLIKNF